MTPEGLESLVVVEPWKTVWPNLPALLMAMLGAWGLRRHMRPAGWMVGLLGLALVVRVLVLPLGQHQFDGHEADYLDLWMGERALTQGGTLLYPAMQWLYAGLGQLAPFAWAPVGLNLLLSLLSLAALGGFVTRMAGPRAAVGAVSLMALWGNHAFWSSSAYNVMLPHALSMVALWALACWIRGSSALYCGLLAGGCAALAVGTRLESVLVAPAGLALILLYRPPKSLHALPGLLGGAFLGAFSAWYVLLPGHPPGSGQRAMAFATNWGLMDYFAPFGRPVSLVFVAVAVVAALWASRRLAATLLLLVLTLHLASATFDDYGFRHLLSAHAALAVLFALPLERNARLGGGLLGLAGVVLMVDLADVRARYYASEEHFEASLSEELPLWSWEQVQGCAVVCEDSRVIPEGEQLSHFNLLDAGETQALRARQGCIYWLVGLQDHRWSSRGVRDRSLRLQALYDVEAVAVVKEPSSGYVGLVVDVGERHEPRPWNLRPRSGI